MNIEVKIVCLKDLLGSMDNSSGLVEVCRQDPGVSLDETLGDVNHESNLENTLSESTAVSAPKSLSRLDRIVASLSGEDGCGSSQPEKRHTQRVKFDSSMGKGKRNLWMSS